MTRLKALLFSFLFAVPCLMAAQNQPEVTLFYSPHCKVCLGVKQGYLPAVKEKYAEKIQWVELNTDEDQIALARLYALADQHGRRAVVPSILAGKTFMSGRIEITQGLEPAIDKLLASDKGQTAESQPVQATTSLITETFKKMSVMTVIGSGLVDGINPCAFAVIVFFVSFLAVYGYRRRDIIWVGSAYCAAVFITYLLIGLGLFKVLYALSSFYLVMKIFYYLIATGCFVLFGLSIYDFIIYRKTGQSEGLILQLPKYLKLRMHKVIGDNLRSQENRTPIRLLFASLAVGFVVSLIEAVCTGQVYVPTIAFIMKDPDMRTKAFSYLLLYNAMFIAPLVGVFALSMAGYNSDTFNSLLKKHMGLAKLLLAGVFLALGIMLISNI